MTARVVIAQPYVPKYRVAFFEMLRHRLAEGGVDCVVAASMPHGDQAARGDAVRPQWLVPVKNKGMTVGHRSIDFDISPAPWKHTDAVILGLEGSSLPVYKALLTAKSSGVRVGLWGHVRPYVAAGNALDLWLERQQMHAAHHIFAYTPGGTNYALTSGQPSHKITTVMNTLDTTALETARDNLTQDEIASYSKRLGVESATTFCFVGGIDESKRIDFLSAVLDRLWKLNPSIRLLVGGDGPQKDILRRAFKRGQAIDLGYLDVKMKALTISVSHGILMPGRVGLIAVDALVMGIPIFTTDWPFHAPEVEYLKEGESRITTKNDVESYVKRLLTYATDTVSPTSRPVKGVGWEYPSLNKMVANFSDGVIAMLGSEHSAV